ncbi:MAG: Ribosomal RNA small subunit methyltransferase I [Candidatus Woesebacteria bacterium GW2011_GWB1_38_5]|uniref:Ribosomal RNA small subunit methyltransferase I n=1 Tax=Candidatus Woesebacteria bacterium GW2011_GWB1_38_5 TaxID=1618568 RepID=A0A0G0NBU7_9BACT|nr:MAG: Ribosomal RNA small subunit methyltransferase I [Candidatus Woesebacteria bacterium GW2011_GWB1_38_5]
MSGTLYIVATPIGNLKDVTLRAITTLSDADIILCEDTRVTGKLLSSLNSKFQIHNSKLLSYHQHSSDSRKLEILQILQSGKNVALVTDAGTPGISDPGNELISYLLSLVPDLKVVPIPGPSAITTALSVSGFNVNKYVFLGFMPKKKKEKLFNWLKEGKISFAYYDSPHRVIKNLREIPEKFGEEIEVFVARELTKIHETLYRGSIMEVIAKMENGVTKGEFVVVINFFPAGKQL